ncbi:MAG: hypothetical protein SWK90_12995 [Chloroflexota bacterium]|nr:hypothetical protein [Chloroflexota bacterium]
MTSKRFRDPSSEKGSKAAPASLPLLALLLSASALLFTACGTLEVGFVSPTAVSDGGDNSMVVAPTSEDTHLIPPMTPTPVPDDYVPPTPEPAFTPMPADAYPAPSGLCIAFVEDGDIWLWTAEEREATLLTSADDHIDTVKISDDGEIVAFRRGDELWTINSDGTGERQLLGAEDFDAMETEPADAEVRPGRFEWVPGTHTLAFNTHLRLEAKDVLADDLRLVDADTLAQTILLPPGEGGQFHYSPDGSQIAIVTTGDISLINADGGNRRDSVLTYTRVAMYSEDDYYVQPTWAADGGSLMVAIPPADPHAKPVQPTTIWQIPTDGTPASLITDIAAFPEKGAVAFSHGLTYVAYVELPQSGMTPTEKEQIWLKVMRLENGDWAAYPIYGDFYGWAPNSRRFAFLADTGHQMSQLQIRQYSGLTIPGSIGAGTSIHDVRWVDADHYLFLVGRDFELGAEGDSWDLVLGDIEGSSAVLATTADLPTYDFARTPGVSGMPTTTDTWVTYTNNIHHFSLQHPPEFDVSTGDPGDPRGFIGDKIVFSVGESNPYWVGCLSEALGDCPVMEVVETTLIAEQEATRIRGYVGAVGGNIPQQYITYVILRDRVYYTFTLHALSRDSAGQTGEIIWPLGEEDIAVFEQIMGTLQFLE